MRAASLLAGLALLPVPAAAHPHVFADSRVELVMDAADRLVAVRLTWSYDEWFSLILLEDLGLDGDGDGVLDAAERRALAEGVLDWPADFGGDLLVERGGAALPLGARTEAAVGLEAGRVVETHLRALAEPAPAPVTVQNFDPYYYVAYTIQPEVAVTGAPGCAAEVVPADLLSGQAEVDRLYEGLDVAGAPPDVELPPIGHAFSDRVEVTCAPS